jgi:hypothetical protein
MRDAAVAPSMVANLPAENIPAAINAMKITDPPPIPNKLGSPRGLRVETWMRVPASPRHPPAIKLTPILGSLISHTIVWRTLELSSVRTFNISDSGALLGPVNKPSNAIMIDMMSRQEYLEATPIRDI